MTKAIKASEARRQFSQLLNEVFRRESRVLVEKSGIPVAAIISAKDLQLLARLEAERAERFKIPDEIGDAFWGDRAGSQTGDYPGATGEAPTGAAQRSHSMTKAKVVLDTNVLASGLTGFRTPSSTVAKLLKLWRLGGFELVPSEPILTELAHTLQSTYFRRRLIPAQINSAMSLFRSETTITPVTTKV
jgi:prevent-host-death family protein